MLRIILLPLALFLALKAGPLLAVAPSPVQERMAEWTIESGKAYADPFNDVDVDVVFEREGQSWRVPTFWRGGGAWTVRFAPPRPGKYRYHLESTDKDNPDLNGHAGQLEITPYRGPNTLFKHGPFRVSANKRYLEHLDGTPFYWLGDTWWPGLSTRLAWSSFQQLTADRKAKGFTVVQLVAGLKDPDEPPPSSPGFCNEGGCVWEPRFARLNPRFFDAADRRIQHLLDNELAPAIVGAWFDSVSGLGVAKMKQHWRYIIARYGAYPVFWVIGGEVYDQQGGWTEVGRYVRQTDPYHHPTTVHEVNPDNLPLQDESTADFYFPQPAHFGWSSIAVEVARVNTYYARTDVTKPVVVGEMGYEHLAGEHLEDFQRMAFWLGMLNGAAGHSYGADGVWESSSTDKPFPQTKFASFFTWEDGMKLPGSYQIGLGARLLRQYEWWKFQPRPEWLAEPRGTTLLEPRSGSKNSFHVDLLGEWPAFGPWGTPPQSEWAKRKGNFLRPYAAGIPGVVRFVYTPRVGVIDVMNQSVNQLSTSPTVLQLEPGVRYHAYYWDPSLGVKVDLGAVERPSLGKVIRSDDMPTAGASGWSLRNRALVANVSQRANLVAAVNIPSDTDSGLVLRYQNDDNFIAAVYSPAQGAIYVQERKDGKDSAPLGKTAVVASGGKVRLSMESRDGVVAASLTDGARVTTTPIVDVKNQGAGAVALVRPVAGPMPVYGKFELRESPELIKDARLEKKLYDARGVFRGELAGPAWDDYGKRKHLLLDAYRPEKFPHPQDWVLVLEAQRAP